MQRLLGWTVIIGSGAAMVAGWIALSIGIFLVVVGLISLLPRSNASASVEVGGDGGGDGGGGGD